MMVMSGCGGDPVASMMLTCVIVTVEAEVLPAAKALASVKHVARNRLIP
jgi:hypothetical protein